MTPWRTGPKRLTGTKTLRSVSSTAAAGLVVALAISLIPRSASSDAPRIYAIRDAQIVTGTGKTIQKGTIVFRDGLIVDLGESAHIPPDARVIDGSGLTVYPGLIDG